MVVASVNRETSPRSEVTIRGGWPSLIDSSLSSLFAPCSRINGSLQAATSWSNGLRSFRLPPTLMTSTLDGIKAWEVERRSLIPPEPDVHRLYRLAGGPLYQIVQGAHDYHPSRVRVAFEADVRVVGAGQNLGIGVAVDALRFLDDPHERFVGVCGTIDLPEVFVGQILAEKDVSGDEDSADSFDRRRGEGDPRWITTLRGEAEFLDDLGGVAVCGRRKRAHFATAMRMMRGWP